MISHNPKSRKNANLKFSAKLFPYPCIEMRKTLLGSPGNLIHEGDSRLTYAEMKKMGLICPITLTSEITKMVII